MARQADSYNAAAFVNLGIVKFGSGALPGLMLDPGLLKTILGGCFSYCKSLYGPILIPFLTLRAKANLYLT